MDPHTLPLGLAHHIRNLTGLCLAISQSDTDLLTAFNERGDGDSFTALVVRHGQAVWTACRQVLDNNADAEDAFQATFIALARSAKTLRGETLAGWLRKVAHRVALDACKARRRRTCAHRRLCERATTSRDSEAPPIDDLWGAVREELAELPERFRIPLALFYLDGKSQSEVAELLSLTDRSVRNRLVKGLAALRERLSSRGMVVTSAALVAALGHVPTLSAMPTSLMSIAATSALAISRGETVATPAAMLAEQVAGVVRWSQSKKLLAILVLALGIGVAVAGWQAMASSRTEVPQQIETPSLSITPMQVAAPIPAGPVVSGVVNDSDGKPIANADVAVFLSSPPSESNPTGADRVVGVGRADKDGAFRIVLLPGTPTKPLMVLAAAQKKAANAVEVKADALTEVRVQLTDAELVQGIARTQEGKPVAKARVRVWQVGPIWSSPSLDVDKDPAPPVPFWPTATTTNEKGEFTLTGLTRTVPASVEVVHPTYARTDAPRLGTGTKLNVYLRLPKLVTGRVVAGDPPKPVARVMVGYEVPRLFNKERRTPLVLYPVERDGTFKIPVPRLDYANLHAIPPAGSPFRQAVEQVELNDKEQADVELALPAAKR